MTIQQQHPAYATTSTGATEGFVAFEYSKVRAPRGLEALTLDTYGSFGWAPFGATRSAGADNVTLSLKRDRSIRNRPMVQETQRKAVAALEKIARLERSRTSVPTAVATTLGLIGCIPLAAAVFLITGGAAGVLSTVLGIVGIGLWLGGGVAYVGLERGRSATIDARIDEEQDRIFEAGAQAARLLR
ncbi:hypothetical protein ACDF64_14250 [Agromyces sp. MMS24-JH15]|uniref:hypothetical protein n=1 Tax=Agromyces sp. MMS24-JH15 TaxID=3243765 RepID=UPI0037496814